MNALQPGTSRSRLRRAGRWCAQLPQRLLIGLVQAYRLLLSPWLGPHCRYSPTCSEYALQALRRHGAVVGGYWALRRLVRCHPWCKGGDDPVPDSRPRLFSSLRDTPPT